jgi:ABC-type dipeptide/oligopeptide/nickel transport system ATPase subunit/GNAT superfamily N-acetyltransferase
MPRIDSVNSCIVKRSIRVQQLEGLFDIAPASRAETRIEADLPLNARPWNVGLIVGPSGSGKSTLARELFPEQMNRTLEWDSESSLLDAFPRCLGIKEITGVLSSVGFSSPPAWLRPFHTLSNGEQFRASVARLMAGDDDPIVIDEFTSVVDRTVAQIGSHAIQKSVRARANRLVAVSCHYDIVDWLQPDWLFDFQTQSFAWRDLWRRPTIEIDIRRCDRQLWRAFHRHHYLSATIAPSAQCFAAYVAGRAAAFTAVLNFPHATASGWREHRTVCLPDYQGCGIGNTLSETVAACYAALGKPYYSTTSHPAMIAHRLRSPAWRCVRKPGMTSASKSKIAMTASAATRRYTAGFLFTGTPRADYAATLGVVK